VGGGVLVGVGVATAAGWQIKSGLELNCRAVMPTINE